MRRITGIDAAQFLFSSAYAAVLERYKHLIEPDGTWLEVVVGNLSVALFTALRLPRAIRWQVFWTLLWSNKVGGMPIILWQLGRTFRSRARAERIKRRGL